MTFARRCLLVFLCLLAVALPLSAREVVIRHFDARVTVNANGTIDVYETIEAQFRGSGWHGLYRTIPVEYVTPEGTNYTLFLEPLSATDDNANPLKWEQSRQGRDDKFKIYVPDADNSTHTIIFRYLVLDALRFFEDHDELYWNVTGNEWDARIEAASAEIELPSGVTGLHAIAYTGVFGSRAEDAQVSTKDNVVDIATTSPLGYHEGLTAVVGWDKGLVHEPSLGARIWLALRSNWPLFLPIIVFFVMLWLWWTRGRDPERDSITVQYQPPDNLTPAECGTLVDNDAAMRDITATIVDLAVKGYLTIEQKQSNSMLGLSHHNDYVFHLKKPPAQWSGLRPHETEMLSAIFSVDDLTQSTFDALQQPLGGAPSTLVPPGAENYSSMIPTAASSAGGMEPAVALSSLQNHFYTHLPGIRSSIFDALVGDGYYLHRPDSVRQTYIGAGLVIGFLLFAGSGWLSRTTGIASFTWVITAIVTAAIICIFGWFMTARTATGAKTFAKVLGFEDFLGRVEKDRIARLENAPETFEKFLPYAMALHVEKKWVQAFSGISMQPPSWYQGNYGAGFMPYLLVNDLSLMSMQAGSVMASAPRSSSGTSGFGGGGGAGGGFGGGGGGGF